MPGFFVEHARMRGSAVGSDRLHRIGLQAFLALHDGEGDLLAFLEALEALGLDGAEMHEHVFMDLPHQATIHGDLGNGSGRTVTRHL